MSVQVTRASQSHRRRSKGQDAANWWAGLPGVWAVYQPKGAASLAASYTDLSGNGNDAAPGVAPTWDAVNGWIFNGVNQYLDTGFFPATDQNQTIIGQFTNSSSNPSIIAGLYEDSNTSCYIAARSGANMAFANGTGIITGIHQAAGNLAIAGDQGYLDGVAVGATCNPWVGAPVGNITIGRQGGQAQYSAVYIQALVICTSVATAPQVAAAAAEMPAL